MRVTKDAFVFTNRNFTPGISPLSIANTEEGRTPKESMQGWKRIWEGERQQNANFLGADALDRRKEEERQRSTSFSQGECRMRAFGRDFSRMH